MTIETVQKKVDEIWESNEMKMLRAGAKTAIDELKPYLITAAASSLLTTWYWNAQNEKDFRNLRSVMVSEKTQIQTRCNTKKQLRQSERLLAKMGFTKTS